MLSIDLFLLKRKVSLAYRQKTTNPRDYLGFISLFKALCNDLLQGLKSITNS